MVLAGSVAGGATIVAGEAVIVARVIVAVVAGSAAGVVAFASAT